MDKDFSYWYWLVNGSGGKPGYRRLVNRWLLLHIIIGIFVASIIRVDLWTSANAVLLPLVGILIGLSFAWAGNAQALMQSSEIDQLSNYKEGGFTDYVFTYQTAILTILGTLVLWSLAGLRVFNGLWPTPKSTSAYFVVKIILFAASSLTLRECWHVVLGAQWMLLAQNKIQRRKGNKR